MSVIHLQTVNWFPVKTQMCVFILEFMIPDRCCIVQCVTLVADETRPGGASYLAEIHDNGGT